jgi:hypothetical protein
MKIDQEDFNRKAQHIIDTVVKPQVEHYENVKTQGLIRKHNEKLKNDPWPKKLKRWWKFQRWILICKILYIYETNIFRKHKQ